MRSDLRNSDLARALNGGKGNKANKPQRTATKSVAKARQTRTVAVSARPKARFDTETTNPLAPRYLGKLNGAINSAPQAKAAHIANGQYLKGSGPVSLAAALAVADYEFDKANMAFLEEQEAAQSTLDLAQDIADAQEIVDAGGPTQAEIDAAQAVLDDPNATNEQKAAAQDVIDDAEAFADAEDFLDGTTPPTELEIDEAAAKLEEEAPSDADVIAAEDALLAHYKGDLPASEDPEEMRLSDEEQAVVDAVRDANPDAETVGSLLPEHDPTEETVAETPTPDGDDETAGDETVEVDSDDTELPEEEFASND